jgi:hypothetical protein
MSYCDITQPRATRAIGHLHGDHDVDDLCSSDEALVQLYEIDGDVETPQWCEGQRTAFLTEAG